MPRPQKILYVHHGKGIGGAPISLVQLVYSLDRAKYHPVVLFLHDSDAVQLFKDRGIETLGPVNRYDFSHTKVWWYRWFHPHHLLKSLWDSLWLLSSEARFWIEKVSPDIVHLNTSSLLVWGIVARRMGIPVVWHIREPLAPGYLGIRRAVVRWVVGRFATKIVPICHHDALPWKDLSKTKVIYNAVDLQRFNREKALQKPCDLDAIAAKGQIILFLGGLSYEKGTHLILKVFAKLLKLVPNVQLVIAGNFPSQSVSPSFLKRLRPSKRFADRCHSLITPIVKNVHLIGVRTDVPQLLSRTSCLVVPSVVGHFARPAIEAAAMGVPVVSSNLRPLDELVSPQTGFLIDSDNLDAWVACLHEIVSSTLVSENREGYESDFADFGLDSHVKNVVNLYEQITSR